MPLTAQEQLILEMINRARLDPAGEAARLRIGLNEGLAPGTITAASKQPLASNDALIAAARGHSQHMLNVDKFAHEGIGDGTPGTRMTAAGYVFTGAWTRAENIAFNATTGAINATAFAIKNENDLFIDKGVAGRGHRLNILDEDFREAGIGQLTGVYTLNGTSYNAAMLTQNFAKTGTDVFITGVAITDANHNNFYDIGEARGGITVTVSAAGVPAGNDVTEAAGGYGVALAPSAGPVDVAFSGGSLTNTVKVTLASVTQNVKVDLAGASKIISSGSTTLGDGAASLLLLGTLNLSGTGNAASNGIVGNKGSNVLSGGGGNDGISGGLGYDNITGGAGRDVMTGGAGNDVFRFNDVSETGNTAATRDVITDFRKVAATGADRIHLAVIDAKSSTAGDEAFQFRAAKGAAFTAEGQIRWFQQDLAGTANDKTIILGNTDANLSTAEFQIELKGLVNLAAGDFVL